MKVEIIPIDESYIEGFHAALDAVASERKYLARSAAPPIEGTIEFVRNNIASGNPQLVAVGDGRVVGWCDVIRHNGEFTTHSGFLGIGLLPAYRGAGLGRQLLGATVGRAWAAKFIRVELEVYSDNKRAIALYERSGFVLEGVLRSAALIDGVLKDACLMSVVRPPQS